MRTPQYGRKETMARHSFIQMSKLSNVKGRISYITSHARQENPYATYRTADNTFWSNLAKESQQEFKLTETKGIFKGKERKALEIQIQQTEREIADKLDKIPDTLKADGYPDVQVFMATYRKAEPVVDQYNRDLVKWERQVNEKEKPNRPPEKESVRDRHRASSKEHERSPKTENDNFDIEHDTTGQNLCLAEFHISLKCLSNFIKKPPASYS